MKIYNTSYNKNNYESDNESDLDISWVQEQEKLQHIHENYFKEPMTMIDIFFIYINTNGYIEKVNYLQQDLSFDNNSSIIHNNNIIQLIEQHKYLSNNKYKIQDVLLYNVSLNPENIQSYSRDEDILKSSSKFLEPLSIVHDFVIPPSIFIFHKINSIFFIFKQLSEIKSIPKSIMKSSLKSDNVVTDNDNNDIKQHKTTKKVRILEKNNVTKLKLKNTITRKQKK
jgi:hypothetical protein